MLKREGRCRKEILMWRWSNNKMATLLHRCIKCKQIVILFMFNIIYTYWQLWLLFHGKYICVCFHLWFCVYFWAIITIPNNYYLKSDQNLLHIPFFCGRLTMISSFAMEHPQNPFALVNFIFIIQLFNK